MSVLISYDQIYPLQVNKTYKEKTCILNKNQDCAIKHIKNCKKFFKKNCGWCKQKCLCNKINNKKFCKKYNLQNGLLKKMEYESNIFYKDFFLPRFLENPKLSRFNYPDIKRMSDTVFFKNYTNWLANNQQYYSNWARMFASQNSPAIYNMGASIVIGSELPYN